MSKEGRRIFAESIAYALDNEDSLRRNYGERVIAIYGQEGVIDDDADKSALLRRVRDKDGALIGTIDEIILRADSHLSKEGRF